MSYSYISKMFDEELKEFVRLLAERQGYKPNEKQLAQVKKSIEEKKTD